VFCDEHGIGGGGEHRGDNDAQLGRISVFYHEASGGTYVPRAVFFDLEPGVIGAVRASPLRELFRPGNLVNHARRQKLGQRPLQTGYAPILLTSPPEV
jgi:tubulin beta